MQAALEAADLAGERELGYAIVVRMSLAGALPSLLPQDRGEWSGWLARMLARDSRCWRERPEMIGEVSSELQRVMGLARRGSELDFARELVRRADHRGTDVVLSKGLLDRQLRQLVPFPSAIYDWRPVAKYCWRQGGHINVLELQALLDYLRQAVDSGRLHGCRHLHVLDSLVATAVVAKGRSSARALNHPLRRIAALSLAADLYVFPMWTLSPWMPADRASRWGHAAYPEEQPP